MTDVDAGEIGGIKLDGRTLTLPEGQKHGKYCSLTATSGHRSLIETADLAFEDKQQLSYKGILLAR